MSEKEKPEPKKTIKKSDSAGKGIEIKDKVKVDFDPDFNQKKDDNRENKTDENFDDIEEEFKDDPDTLLIIQEMYSELEQLDEVLSISNRIKKRQVLRRYRSRINISRKRAMRKRATTTTIQKRARRSAISNIKKRYSHTKKGATSSYAERSRLEKMVAQRKGLVRNSTRKLIRVKRNQERARMSRQ